MFLCKEELWAESRYFATDSELWHDLREHSVPYIPFEKTNIISHVSSLAKEIKCTLYFINCQLYDFGWPGNLLKY